MSERLFTWDQIDLFLIHVEPEYRLVRRCMARGWSRGSGGYTEYWVDAGGLTIAMEERLGKGYTRWAVLLEPGSMDSVAYVVEERDALDRLLFGPERSR